MTVLSSKQVVEEKNTAELDAITSLTLTHKALSDVSCLNGVKNLQRLDLAFNNLYTLEGLKSCVNLKWLSVVQNKLQSLKGVEGLVNLTVLNAGKNKLRSMEEVRSLVSLRALILNDNEIVSLCGIDQMKELNTLVLSRNPIREIGESLAKAKLIRKLSLSNCQLQAINSSIKSCTELGELRLSHNEIKTLPAELAQNMRIQNLDLGNNFIMRWSDLKVLSSLMDLRNVNLLGNPIAEKDKLAKKIKELVPRLQIFNAKPMDKSVKNGMGGGVDNSSLEGSDKLMVEEGYSNGHFDVVNNDVKDELKPKKIKRKELVRENASNNENVTLPASKPKNKMVKVEENESIVVDEGKTTFAELDVGKKLICRTRKTNEQPKVKASDQKGDGSIAENILNSNSKKVELDAIDDGETPFDDLFTANDANSLEKRDVDTIGGVANFPEEKNKIKSQGMGMGSAVQLLSPIPEVGLGGASAWD